MKRTIRVGDNLSGITVYREENFSYVGREPVVDGIHNILKSLSDITNGNLDTTVMVSGNPEFQQLSFCR